MIANIIVTVLILSYTAFVISMLIKDQKKAKVDGIPKGCFSCAAFKQGNCPSHKNCSGNRK